MIGYSDATVNTENVGKTKKNPRHRIYWKDVQATKGVHLEFDGIPFVILGHKNVWSAKMVQIATGH